MQAFEWIAENAIAPAVVSMSVAGDLSPAVNEAARRLVEDRAIPLVVAAGNSYESACLMSPASSPWVISVAASDDQDRRWAKSNWWVGGSGGQVGRWVGGSGGSRVGEVRCNVLKLCALMIECSAQQFASQPTSQSHTCCRSMQGALR